MCETLYAFQRDYPVDTFPVTHYSGTLKGGDFQGIFPVCDHPCAPVNEPE